MRTTRSESEWQAIISEHEGSGRTVEEFCAGKEISKKSFYTWRMKLGGSETIHTAPMPPMVVERSFSDVSFYAGMLVDKFVYHIPFNRQFERLKADGITVSRATLPSQSMRAIELLDPIYRAQEKSVLSSSVIAMDDTWMKVGVISPGKMHKGHFWPIYGDKDEIIFPYRESRRDEEVETILGDYKGTLLADGHLAYDKYAARHAEVIRAQCWVHTRRNFFELEGPPEFRDGAQKLSLLLDGAGGSMCRQDSEPPCDL